ncbi:hypothetical protein FRUB_00161 [Fimbriiglobus ruber]|uniref:Uncharacterized protein n=1 Tax=Fimbriiglobus ruber TaxID=1908690 RepID=A0A225DYR9_9BACT|nr:hypothetical protein FRUB_00161 [Fimbriiglobus ruber]
MNVAFISGVVNTETRKIGNTTTMRYGKSGSRNVVFTTFRNDVITTQSTHAI